MYIRDDCRLPPGSSIFAYLRVSGEVLRVSDVSPGWHTVSLAATDSDGLTGTDGVTFLIGNYAWLPMVMLGVP